MSRPPAQNLLERIAEALERLSPGRMIAPDFTAARVWRYPGFGGGFDPAPDPALPIALLVGIDRQKQTLMTNLERFAQGLPANHVLLWGVRGSGKSSLTKAAFGALMAGQPDLRLIEVDRDHLAALPDLFDLLRSQSLRFLVLCDDLSFEEGPGGPSQAAKSLKSALEGGVMGPPANVLFLATSNRRHLMPRGHDQQNRGQIAAQEDAEEEISVSDRFGLWIGFPPMDQPTYLAAVRGYADSFGLKTKDLDRRALQWAAQRGGRSGRVAWQFIRDLAGEQKKPLPF